MYEELVNVLRDTASLLCDYVSKSKYHKPGKKEQAGFAMRYAADAIEELRYALLLMVLQYCTTDDGFLYHSFMTAGECAFAVLGLENGQQEAPLWSKIDRWSNQQERGFR